MLPEGEKGKRKRVRKNGGEVVEDGTEQKPVNRLRHVDDTTKGRAVNFKLPPWPEAT